jgi:hypothetical protein
MHDIGKLDGELFRALLILLSRSKNVWKIL